MPYSLVTGHQHIIMRERVEREEPGKGIKRRGTGNRRTGDAEEEKIETGEARPGGSGRQVVSRRVQHWPRQDQAIDW